MNIQLILKTKSMRVYLIFILSLVWCGVTAQKGKENTREDYILTYKTLAMQEMKRVGIPASITLAQGILESRNGNSRLATKANNHFGIKCHDWNGPSVRHDDDARNECFRKYKNPERSYIDHSDFLKDKSRYSSLFDLKPDDYKGWARGLKKAGYATSSTYAQALIKIIEEEELYIYDQQVLASDKSRKGTKTLEDVLLAGGREMRFNNRVKYIIADSGDTYESLSEELYLLSWQLPRYNGKQLQDKLEEGEYIYLQPKRNKASVENKTHIIKKGENLHLISQQYAIKEEKLRKRNKIPDDAEPVVGSVIMLRGKMNGTVLTRQSEKKEQQLQEEPEFRVEIDLGS